MSEPALPTRTSRYFKSALTGATLGLAVVLCGALWQTFTGQSAFVWRTVAAEGAVAIVAGGVIGVLHHATRKIRTRGRLYDYGSWMIACTIGVFVVVAPDLPQKGLWWTLLFALWLGVSGGLAFGVISRQLSGHRW